MCTYPGTVLGPGDTSETPPVPASGLHLVRKHSGSQAVQKWQEVL